MRAAAASAGVMRCRGPLPLLMAESGSRFPPRAEPRLDPRSLYWSLKDTLDRALPGALAERRADPRGSRFCVRLGRRRALPCSSPPSWRARPRALVGVSPPAAAGGAGEVSGGGSGSRALFRGSGETSAAGGSAEDDRLDGSFSEKDRLADTNGSMTEDARLADAAECRAESRPVPVSAVSSLRAVSSPDTPLPRRSRLRDPPCRAAASTEEASPAAPLERR